MTRTGPLTWYQEMVWWNQHGNPPDEEYPPMGDVWYLPGGPSPQRVRAVFDTLTRRHEVLRTSIAVAPDGTVFQEVRPDEAVVPPVEVIDLTTLREDVRGTLGTFRRPSGESLGVLRWRAMLAAKGDRVLAVGFAGDRYLMDAWGVIELRRQFTELLQGPPDSEPPPDSGAPPSPLNPLDRVALERSAEGRARADAALQQLEHVLTRWPSAMFDRPARPPERPRFKEAVLRSSDLLAATDRVCRIHRMTRPSVILAAVAAVLSVHTGRPLCAVRSVSANRTTAAERTSVQGLYQQAHLLLDLSGDPTVPELLKLAWRESVSAYQHTQYPPGEFHALLARVGEQRGGVPAFQFDFDYVAGGPPVRPRQSVDRTREDRVTWARAPIEHRGSEQGRSSYALFQAMVAGEELVLNLDADTALIPGEEIDQMIRRIELGLRRFASNPGLRLSEFAEWG